MTAPEDGATFVGSPGQIISITFSSTHTYNVTNSHPNTFYSWYRTATVGADAQTVQQIGGLVGRSTNANGTFATPLQDFPSGSKQFAVADGTVPHSAGAGTQINNVIPVGTQINNTGHPITFYIYGEG